MKRATLMLCLCATAALKEDVTLQSLERRLAQLEAAVEANRRHEMCEASYPTLEDGYQFHYEGCNRNTHRNSTASAETCQNGIVSVYNTSTLGATGLFDIAIAANVPTRDVWHFLCTLTRDAPHTAICSLTFETPERPEGPAWMQLLWREFEATTCVPAAATIVGAYFYDALTNDAGVYSFYASKLNFTASVARGPG